MKTIKEMREEIVKTLEQECTKPSKVDLMIRKISKSMDEAIECDSKKEDSMKIDVTFLIDN